MKEKGPIRQTLETAGKVWTIISMPLEIFLLGHGIVTGNKLEAILGAGGLIGDLFLWKWFNRDKKNQLKQTPLAQIAAYNRGSERIRARG